MWEGPELYLVILGGCTLGGTQCVSLFREKP